MGTADFALVPFSLKFKICWLESSHAIQTHLSTVDKKKLRLCVCVCVCVCEREREWMSVCMCVLTCRVKFTTNTILHFIKKKKKFTKLAAVDLELWCLLPLGSGLHWYTHTHTPHTDTHTLTHTIQPAVSFCMRVCKKRQENLIYFSFCSRMTEAHWSTLKSFHFVIYR